MDEFEEVFGRCVLQEQPIKVCKHEMMEKDENGLHICKSCGHECEIFDYAPEWRVYSDDPSKNPIRCHNLTSDQTSLDKILEKQNIILSEFIKTRIEERYNKIVQSVRNRGKARLSIVAACLFVIYKEIGETKTSEHIRGMFSLTKKRLTTGLNTYYSFFPEERTKITQAHELVNIFVTPEMKPFLSEIVSFCQAMEKRTSTLNRSCPQAVAAACILFYVTREKGMTVQKSAFANSVGLSEITINRLVKEIDLIRNRFEIVDGVTKLK